MNREMEDWIDGAIPSVMGLELAARAVRPIAASGALFERIVRSLGTECRFEHFVPTVAAMLAVSPACARGYLDALAEPNSWERGFSDGMDIFHVQGGAQLPASITGFVRLEAGATLDEHEHLGAETVFVLQGSCVDGERIVRPGMQTFMPPGSRHRVVARSGPDLVFLAVVAVGISFSGRTLLAADPSA